jgi:FkbH-like protein
MSIDRLRALHAEGGLAAEYPRIPALLAGADRTDLRQAGALLAGIDPDAVLAAHPATPVLSVALTGSSTLAPLAPAVTAELARHGLLARVHTGDPGAFALELSAPRAADVTVCLLDGSAVFDRLGTAPWNVDEVAAAAADLLVLLTRLAHGHRGCGQLVFTTLPLWTTWSAQVLDLRQRARLGAVWRRFNADLLDLAATVEDVCVVDLDPITGDTGPARDSRLESYARVAYTDPVLAELARHVGHLARALRGRPRKCLVLDLDGTLWGGTLAESGGTGLEMAHGYRGEAHRRFQQVVAQLGAQGVLLAVCSKNDPAEVAEVLRTHPDLLVRLDDFTAVLADWAPKTDTIGRIAETIGIGTDSLVLVDDSSTEAGLVRSHHPEIAVVEVDVDDPAGHVSRLLDDGWFDATAITDEDRARAGHYRAEARRAELRAGLGSLQDYLVELDTQVEVFQPGSDDVARLAQLTQRTNQFSLTTRRLDEAAVRSALVDSKVVIAPIRVRDRFGDHGVVGVACGHRRDGELHIEDLAMSCRVLGRGVETAWLGELLRWAAGQGLTGVVGCYRPTPRNGRVRDLYPEHGFAPTTTEADGTRWFRHDLGELPAPPPHVTVRSALPVAVPTGGNP